MLALDAVTGKKVWDYEAISSFHYGRACVDRGRVDFRAEQQGMFPRSMRNRQPLVISNWRADNAAPRPTRRGQQYVALHRSERHRVRIAREIIWPKRTSDFPVGATKGRHRILLFLLFAPGIPLATRAGSGDAPRRRIRIFNEKRCEG